MENIEDKVYFHQLFDCYKDLLTEKQVLYFEYYYLDDYSLAEIAQLLNVSRNAVHEQLKIVINHLEKYERVLHIRENKQKRQNIYQKIKESTNMNQINALIEDLEKVE